MTKTQAINIISEFLEKTNNCQWYSECTPIKTFINSFKSAFTTIQSYPDTGDYPKEGGYCYFSGFNHFGIFLQRTSEEDTDNNSLGVTGYKINVYIEPNGDKLCLIYYYHTVKDRSCLSLSYNAKIGVYGLYFSREINRKEIGKRYRGGIYPNEPYNKRLSVTIFLDDHNSLDYFWEDNALHLRKNSYGNTISDEIIEKYGNTSVSSNLADSSNSSGCVVALLIATFTTLCMAFVII